MLAFGSEEVRNTLKKSYPAGISLSQPSNNQRLLDRLAKLSLFKIILIGLALALMLMLGLFAGVAGYKAVREDNDPVRALINDMTDAAEKRAVVNSDYAEINVIIRHGRIAVVAGGVDKEMCPSVAWYFVHRGIVSINGTSPNRASLSNLKALCTQSFDATLAWWPKAAGQ